MQTCIRGMWVYGYAHIHVHIYTQAPYLCIHNTSAQLYKCRSRSTSLTSLLKTLCMQTYVYIYLHKCTYIYIHTHIFIYKHENSHCIHTYTYSCIHPALHPSIHPSIHACIHPSMHPSNHPTIQPSNHACMHACMHPGRQAGRLQLQFSGREDFSPNPGQVTAILDFPRAEEALCKLGITVWLLGISD